jgi:hypothetical protein
MEMLLAQHCLADHNLTKFFTGSLLLYQRRLDLFLAYYSQTDQDFTGFAMPGPLNGVGAYCHNHPPPIDCASLLLNQTIS